MEKWIILITNQESTFKEDILELEEIAECDSGLKIFNSLDEASDYQDTHGIDGQCVELPIY